MKERYNLKGSECDCEYKLEGLLEKNVQAVHGSVQNLCHYSNNDKDCDFDDQCIFAHEESPECKYGEGCERIMCMIQHEERDVSDDEDDDGSEVERDEENDVDEEKDEMT